MKMTNTELLNVYENVAHITGDMLEAARAKDWEKLAVLETQCSSQVATLKQFDDLNKVKESLTPELKQKKIVMIKKILADDKAIRDITEPWMLELAKLMKSAQTSRQLNNSYGAQV